MQKIAGLIGQSISQSLSPKIFKMIDPTVEYKLFDFSLFELDKFMDKLDESNLTGINITTPFKEKVHSYLHKISPVAKSVGSINAIHIIEDKLIGHNTDVLGLQATFESNSFSLKDKDV